MLRFCDSFDHYNTTILQADRKWTSHTNDPTIGTGRFGSGMTLIGYDSRSVRRALDAQATWILGVAVNLSNINGNGHLLSVLDSGTKQVELSVNSSGKLVVTRAGTTLGTGTTTLLTNVWYFVELKVTIHNSTGIAVARLDGNVEVNLSGVDTQNTANATANQVQIGQHDGGFSVSATFDDFYACDGVDSGISGAPNDDFLGDVRIEALFPNGNGATSNLVGSDGNSTDNYLLVDETPPNDDTDYVESATAGEKDTYALTNLTPTSGIVFGTQLLAWAKKTDAGARTVALIARESGGTEEDSAAFALSTTYQYFVDQRDADPDSVQWTISSVNASEAGVKVG